MTGIFRRFAIVCALTLAGACPLSVRASTLYVSRDGHAGATGTRSDPLGGIQEALDRAAAGDTVDVAPGVYRGDVSFKKSGAYGKPVVLQGEPGAILDGSRNVRLVWRSAHDLHSADPDIPDIDGLYGASVNIDPFTVVASGKLLTTLKESVAAPQNAVWSWPKLFASGVGTTGWTGVKALSMYMAGKRLLLVRFGDNRSPASMDIEVAQARHAVVTIDGVDRCVVRGLTLENASDGVMIEDSLGSVVENCRIRQIDFGVYLDHGADRCTIRSNEISEDPYSGADPRQPGQWNYWQVTKRAGFGDRCGIYLHRTAGGHEIHDNFIHDDWDGIHDGDQDYHSIPKRPSTVGFDSNLDVHHNRIFNCTDDGLECSGAGQNCRWRDNWIQHVRCGLRIKDPTRGPLYAYDNIFIDNHEDCRNYGEIPETGAVVWVYQNTSTSDPAISSNKVYASGVGTPNYHYYNNVFYCRHWWLNDDSGDPNWHGDNNVYIRCGADAAWDVEKALARRLGLDIHSKWVDGAVFADPARGDLALTAGSPARGAGADLARPPLGPLPGAADSEHPDCGALPFGAHVLQVPRHTADAMKPPAGEWPEADAVRAPAAEQAQGGAPEPAN